MTDPVTPALTGPQGRLVAAHREEVLDALRRHGVENARLFGSVARGEDDLASDIDLLVDLPPGTGLLGIAAIQAELEAILGVTVDLVPAAGLKDNIRASVERDLIAL